MLSVREITWYAGGGSALLAAACAASPSPTVAPIVVEAAPAAPAETVRIEVTAPLAADAGAQLAAGGTSALGESASDVLPTAEGGPAAAITGAVAAQRPSLERCHAQGPSARSAGRLVVKVTVAPTGAVSAIAVRENTGLDPTTTKCIVLTLRALSVAPSDAGDAVVPIAFKPAPGTHPSKPPPATKPRIDVGY